MSEMAVPGAFMLGLPTALDRARAHALEAWATTAFQAAYGESRDLGNDLLACARLFDPVAQGQRLRRELAAIASSDVPPDFVPHIWYLSIADGAIVLTPEGVSGLHALRWALEFADEGQIVRLASSAQRASDQLLVVYRHWSQHRIRGVIGLLRGEEKPLQVQAAGLLIALLLNDHIGEDRALPRYGESDAGRRDEIDEAFFAPIARFTQELAPQTKLKSGAQRLITGWTMGEVARRLGPALVVTKPADNDPGLAYVAPSGVDAAIDLLTRDLARGNRKQPTVAQLEKGLDVFVEEFRASKGAFAGYGILHETNTNTARLRRVILRKYEEQLNRAESDGSIEKPR